MAITLKVSGSGYTAVLSEKKEWVYYKSGPTRTFSRQFALGLSDMGK